MKECVTAHQLRHAAPKIQGAKAVPRSYGVEKQVGEQCAVERSGIVRYRGQDTRADVGMSNEKMVRIHLPERPRVPGEGSSAQGKPDLR